MVSILGACRDVNVLKDYHSKSKMVKDRYIWRRVALMSQEVWSDKSRIDSRRGPSASGGDVVSHWGLGTALTPHVRCPNLKNTNTEIQNYTNTQIHRDKTQAQRLKLHPGGDVVSQWGTGTGRTSHVLCTASIYNTLLYTWPAATTQQYTALYLPRDTLLLLGQKPDNTT